MFTKEQLAAALGVEVEVTFQKSDGTTRTARLKVAEDQGREHENYLRCWSEDEQKFMMVSPAKVDTVRF